MFHNRTSLSIDRIIISHLWYESNIFDKVEEKFDYIVSNPPYIETDVVKGLEKEVAQNEPILALDGGESGLDFYEEIIEKSIEHLNSKGKLFFEIGYNQGEKVSRLMKQKFKNVEIIKDYLDNDRVVVGEMYDWKIEKNKR